MTEEQLKKTIKKCLYEIFNETGFMQQLVEIVSKKTVNAKPKTMQSKTGLNFNNIKRTVQQQQPKSQPRYTGNPLIDKIMSESTGADDIISESPMTSAYNIPRGGTQGNVKVEILENVDYSDFLTGVPDDNRRDNLNKVPSHNTPPGASGMPRHERMQG